MEFKMLLEINLPITTLTMNGNPPGAAENCGILKPVLGNGACGILLPLLFCWPDALVVVACGCCCWGCWGKANWAMNGNIFWMSGTLFGGWTPATFCRGWAGPAAGAAAPPAPGTVGVVLRWAVTFYL